MSLHRTFCRLAVVACLLPGLAWSSGARMADTRVAHITAPTDNAMPLTWSVTTGVERPAWVGSRSHSTFSCTTALII